MDHICPGGNQRVYFLCVLRWAGASPRDLLVFYKAAVRSVVEHACVVWHTGLMAEQTDRIESMQRRVLRAIYPDLSYAEALQCTGFKTLQARRERVARAFFGKVLAPDHKLHHLLPEPCQLGYELRAAKKYLQPAENKLSKTDPVDLCAGALAVTDNKTTLIIYIVTDSFCSNKTSSAIHFQFFDVYSLLLFVPIQLSGCKWINY